MEDAVPIVMELNPPRTCGSCSCGAELRYRRLVRAGKQGHCNEAAAGGAQVHTVAWNPLHRRVFLTASADWTVQLWDADITDKVISFGIRLHFTCGVLSPAQHSARTWVCPSRFATSCIYI